MLKNRIPIEVMMKNAISLEDYSKKYPKQNYQIHKEEKNEITKADENEITKADENCNEPPMDINFNVSFKHLSKFNELSLEKKMNDIYIDEIKE